jgi:glutamate-1-semialdehyde 2,1-aminomutase
MEFGATMLALSALGAIALAMALLALKTRLELSLAKHRSLSGHVRMARRIGGLIPFYEYDEAHFFRCDDAPDEIAVRRRAGFMRLAGLYRERFAQTIRRTAEVAQDISDLQFTDAYRVPFQFSRFVRQHLTAGAFVQSSGGVTLIDLDGNHLYDLTGSYGVNVLGYDF